MDPTRNGGHKDRSGHQDNIDALLPRQDAIAALQQPASLTVAARAPMAAYEAGGSALIAAAARVAPVQSRRRRQQAGAAPRAWLVPPPPLHRRHPRPSRLPSSPTLVRPAQAVHIWDACLSACHRTRMGGQR